MRKISASFGLGDVWKKFRLNLINRFSRAMLCVLFHWSRCIAYNLHSDVHSTTATRLRIFNWFAYAYNYAWSWFDSVSNQPPTTRIFRSGFCCFSAMRLAWYAVKLFKLSTPFTSIVLLFKGHYGIIIHSFTSSEESTYTLLIFIVCGGSFGNTGCSD